VTGGGDVQLVSIFDLPRIAGVINVEGRPFRFILPYRDVIKLIGFYGLNIPNIDSIIDGPSGHDFIVIDAAIYSAFFSKLSISGSIDERRYLSVHDDVKSGMKNGVVNSARDHFLFQGYLEGRRAVLLVDGAKPQRSKLTKPGLILSRQFS